MAEHKKTFLGKINGLFPTCKEITMLVVKEQEIELSRGEKIKLFFHTNIVCKFCRIFRKQSAVLHQHIHTAAQKSNDGKVEFRLSEQNKSEMQEIINTESQKP